MNQEDETVGTGTKILVDFAPLLAIVALRVYALSTILYNVMTFNDCPEAAKEIDENVKEAKAEMKKRKIID